MTHFGTKCTYTAEDTLAVPIAGQNKLGDRKTLKVETFNNLWDAIQYCETVDLGDIETTNE